MNHLLSWISLPDSWVLQNDVAAETWWKSLVNYCWSHFRQLSSCASLPLNKFVCFFQKLDACQLLHWAKVKIPESSLRSLFTGQFSRFFWLVATTCNSIFSISCCWSVLPIFQGRNSVLTTLILGQIRYRGALCSSQALKMVSSKQFITIPLSDEFCMTQRVMNCFFLTQSLPRKQSQMLGRF